MGRVIVASGVSNSSTRERQGRCGGPTRAFRPIKRVTGGKHGFTFFRLGERFAITRLTITGDSSVKAPVVLLTGATGFIGGATLAQLLRSYPDCHVLLLVRAATEADAFARVQHSVGRFIEPAMGNLRSCSVICGDLTDFQTFANLRLHGTMRLEDVTHVLHLASNTSFRSVRGVRHTNILGALALAHRMRRVPELKRFLYVGTACICGEESDRIVHEDDYPRYGAKHIVEYTNSKAECEMLLDATAPEMPLIVARPSVVVGHTKLGCLPSASVFWFYRTADLLRRLTCPLDTYNDVVPVDYVADALLHLLFKPELRYRRYHISAGEQSSVTCHEIADVFAQYYGPRPDNPYKVVDFATIAEERHRLGALLGSGDEERLLMALGIYYRFMKMKAEIFDNRRLLDECMPAPPKFTSYLRLCAERPSDRSVYEQMLDDE
jgi:nucleoside-diphosphate-sugar epimerase